MLNLVRWKWKGILVHLQVNLARYVNEYPDRISCCRILLGVGEKGVRSCSKCWIFQVYMRFFNCCYKWHMFKRCMLDHLVPILGTCFGEILDQLVLNLVRCGGGGAKSLLLFSAAMCPPILRQMCGSLSPAKLYNICTAPRGLCTLYTRMLHQVVFIIE